MIRTMLAVTACATLLIGTVQAAEKFEFQQGNPEIKSAGSLTFGPDGVLFVGDAQGAAIYALETKDTSGSAEAVNVDGLDKQIASLLGATTRTVAVNDMAVNPASGKVYLSVSRGRGPDAQPAIIRIGADGKLENVSLKEIGYAKAELPNAPDPKATGRRNASLRAQSITDVKYADGQLIVAGLSNEEFASNLRVLKVPFEKADKGTSVEIYHGAHGKFETRSPVRTFTPYDIEGKTHVVAGYTCTPLVKFPLSDLTSGKKVRGKTIAELGNRNRPLDIISYKQGGKSYLLMANSARGVMKINTDNIDKVEGITERVGGGGTAGLSYVTVDDLKGVQHLDKLNEKSAVVLLRGESGSLDLKTVALP